MEIVDKAGSVRLTPQEQAFLLAFHTFLDEGAGIKRAYACAELGARIFMRWTPGPAFKHWLIGEFK